MFGHRYFGASYYGPRYFGPAGGATPPVTTTVTPTGGWDLSFLNRQRSKDDIRRERERLGIVPKQAKKIERLADKLADDLPPEPNQMLVQIMASKEFNKLLQAFAQRDAERRAKIANFVAQLMLIRILQEREEEEAAIVTLLMEM